MWKVQHINLSADYINQGKKTCEFENTAMETMQKKTEKKENQKEKMQRKGSDGKGRNRKKRGKRKEGTVENIMCVSKIYDNSIKNQKGKIAEYYCNILILHMKWYNIIWE